MNKVFIVTSGCYSDYQIEAVFSTREKAEAYINAKATSYDWSVNEWDIDVESTECHDAIYDVIENIYHRKIYIRSKKTPTQQIN